MFSGALALASLLFSAGASAAPKGRAGLIVELRDDVSTKDLSEKQRSVRARADRVLKRLGENVSLHRRYQNLPMLVLELHSEAAKEALYKSDDVVAIHENQAFERSLVQSLTQIGQATAAARGATSQGVTVAVFDTGANYLHADLGACSAPGQPSTCKVIHAQDFAPDDGALDDHGHGSNVSAIVAGVAPGARIAALDVFDLDGYAYFEDILAAVDWVLNNQALYSIRAINMSLGNGGRYTSPCSLSPFTSVAASLKNAGVLVVASAGNSGFTDGIGHPACVPGVVSVGAVYEGSYPSLAYSRCTDATSARDRMTCFSNSSSAMTIVAPGAIISGGGYSMAGTSQAAPHVAGAVAVVAHFFPAFTPDQIVARLRATGVSVLDTRNGLTFPRLDLAAATAAFDPPPAGGGLSINGGNVFTRSQTVSLLITPATDAGGIGGICLSNSETCTTWLRPVTSMHWYLTAGTGPKTVRVWYRDNAGNVSAPLSTSINLDLDLPNAPAVVATPGAAQMRLTWSGGTDATSGIGWYKVVFSTTAPPADRCTTGTQILYALTASMTHRSLVPGQTYYYRVCPIDRAGNIGAGAVTSAVSN